MRATILHPIGFAMQLPCLRFLVFAGFLFLAGLTSPTTAPWAQEAGEAYMVRDVIIDATDKSALAAKQAALRSGQRRALEQVLRRLTLVSEQEQLPRAVDLEPADFIASFAVADEKTSEVRYLARMTVQFRRSAVQRLLRGTGVSFSETRARPTLVLPVLERDGGRELFAEDNAWLAAWSELALPFGDLLPLTVPLGDLGDMSALDPEAALAPPEGLERFRTMMDKYDCASVAVIHASLVSAGEAAPARMNVVVSRYGATGGGTLVSAYDAVDGETLDALLLRAARDIAGELAEDWKRRTVLRFGEQAELSARVPFSGLDGWLEIRRRLNAVPNIERVAISAITTIDAQVVLHYLGEAERLNTALAAHDLALEDRQGYWYLLRTDLAPQRTDAVQSPAQAVPAVPAKTSE
mgnify:CR=1 FL=1